MPVWSRSAHAGSAHQARQIVIHAARIANRAARSATRRSSPNTTKTAKRSEHAAEPVEWSFSIPRGAASKVPWESCVICTERFVARDGSRRYCRECRMTLGHYVRNGRLVQRQRPLKPLAQSQCKECGEHFTHHREPGIQGRRRTTFCSEACSKRFGDRHSRHHQRQAPNTPYERFSLTEIAERDGRQCHICHTHVSRRDWSMDHLVPMSRGGLHLRANVALAHRRCNSRMGVGRLPAQLRLIG
jgi:5-methylcytosine-specific restriction endonuclease McrA